MNKQKDTCTHFEENKQKNKKTKQKKKKARYKIGD